MGIGLSKYLRTHNCACTLSNIERTKLCQRNDNTYQHTKHVSTAQKLTWQSTSNATTHQCTRKHSSTHQLCPQSRACRYHWHNVLFDCLNTRKNNCAWITKMIATEHKQTHLGESSRGVLPSTSVSASCLTCGWHCRCPNCSRSKTYIKNICAQHYFQRSTCQHPHEMHAPHTCKTQPIIP